MKISLYARLHIKTTFRKFLILKIKNSLIVYPWSLYFSFKKCYFLTYYIVSVGCKHKFHISRVRISQKVNSVIMRNLRYLILHLKMKILIDFHVCISVPSKQPKAWPKKLNCLYMKKCANLVSLWVVIYNFPIT